MANLFSSRSYQQRLADELEQHISAEVAKVSVRTEKTINQIWPWLITFLAVYALDKTFKYLSMAKDKYLSKQKE